MAAQVLELDEGDIRDTNTRSARQIVLQAALLGMLADNVLQNAPNGLGWSIWIAGLAVAVVLVVTYRGARFSREQSAWLAMAVACAVTVAWRDTLQPVNVLATLVALAMFTMSYAGQPASSILSSRLRDVITAWVYAAKDAVSGTAPLLIREAALGSAIRSSAAARRPALRAAVLTAPLVIVFTALLSRADPVFGAVFRLPDIRAEEIASHLLLGGFFAWISAGWMRGALQPTGGRSALPEQLPVKLGVVEITASLGALVALFAVFVAIQLRWLFGGADVVLATTGLSLAEYARRGFFELVTVAALVLPLILGTRAAIADDTGALVRHRRLSSALLILLGAIMTSAILRMWLYVTHFGLTADRLYALVFMAWLGIVFVAMTITVLRGWSRPFAAVTVLSGFAALFALNAANPEAIVARVNLSRSTARQAVDYRYLSHLGGDAVATVAPALAVAEPAPGTCTAAKTLRRRWVGARGYRSNLGTARGRAAVLEHLPASGVQRLCAFVEVRP